MTRRRRAQQQTTIADGSIPLPIQRGIDEAALSRRIQKIDKDLAISVIGSLFPKRLDFYVQSLISNEALKKRLLTREKFDEKMDELKVKLVNSIHLPRGIFEEADERGSYPLHTIMNSIGQAHCVLPEWRQFVQQNFPVSYDNEWQAYLEYGNTKVQSSSVLPMQQRTRTCMTLMKSIIRPDLPSEHSAIVLNRLQKTAVDITDQMSDLCAIIRAIMYRSAQYGYVIRDGDVHVNDSEQVQGLNIAEILPECKVRNKDALILGKYIPVAPFPDNIAELAGPDFQKLFSAEFVQHVFTHHISATYAAEKLKDRHLLWNQLCLSEIPFSVTKLPGLFKTSANAAAAVGNNLSNMWHGQIFEFCLKRVLLLYFRIKLAPEREERYMQSVTKMAATRSNKKRSGRRNISQTSNRQRVRREIQFQRKCAQRISSARNSPQRVVWDRRLALSQERLYRLAVKRGRENQKDSSGGDGEEFVMMNEADFSESDDDSDAEDDVPTYDSVKETSGKRIMQITAFTKKQLSSNTKERELIVKCKTGWVTATELTEKEIAAIVHICSVLGPFMPPQSQKQIIAFKLPIVMICNFLQAACGYQKYNRRLSPLVSAANIHTLNIDAVAIYETLASRSHAENFTIQDAHGMPITSTKWAVANKDATFAAFLDLAKIRKICDDFGLDFSHRLQYRADGTVALVGELQEGVLCSTSWYDQRKSDQKSNKIRDVANKEITANERELVKQLNDNITQLTTTLRPLAAQLRAIKNEILDVKKKRKLLPPGVYRQTLYTELGQKKITRNELLRNIYSLKEQIKSCRVSKYQTLWLKNASANDTANAVKAPASPPTFARPGYEDDAEHLDISLLQTQAAAEAKEIVYSGTGHGIVTQSTTIRMTQPQFEYHIRLYCHFHASQDNCEEGRNANIDSPEPVSCHRLTSGQISQMSFERATRMTREKRKNKQLEVQDSERLLSENSISNATSADQLLQHCTKTRQCLRLFYYSARARKESMTRRFRKSVAYDRLARNERKFVGGHLQIMCVGNAGSGVGSRIGGHLKYGGGQVRARHRRYATVCITDEHNTSQRCSTCFGPVVRAQKRVVVDGKWKTKSVLGSSICYNSDCPSYQHGRNTRNRDVQAAINIALAGVSRLKTGHTLPPFERRISR